MKSNDFFKEGVARICFAMELISSKLYIMVILNLTFTEHFLLNTEHSYLGSRTKNGIIISSKEIPPCW